jgi:polysaccharide export outer membrane protein
MPSKEQLCNCPIPRELTKASLPAYVVEPPDILLIDAVRVVPRPPYRAQPLDLLLIQVSGVLEQLGEPIAGLYPVSPEGAVNLGIAYGSVQVAGLTLEEIKAAIEALLKVQKKVKKPEVVVTVAQSRTLQLIRGEHLVRPDGTVSLGVYGSVRVAGMTVPEVKAALEAHLSQYLLNPELSVDVAAYNTKVFYVVFDGGGLGDQVVRLPITGNETVLDAISQAGGLSPISSRRRIWVARPGPPCAPCDQILPVDWQAITARGRSETNYQLMPGDRVYVQADAFIAANTFMTKAFAPLERLFGITLLGRGLVGTLAVPIRSGNGFGATGTGTSNTGSGLGG